MRVNRVRVCREFGWTFAEFDALSLQDLADVTGVMRAEANLQKAKHGS